MNTPQCNTKQIWSISLKTWTQYLVCSIIMMMYLKITNRLWNQTANIKKEKKDKYWTYRYGKCVFFSSLEYQCYTTLLFFCNIYVPRWCSFWRYYLCLKYNFNQFCGRTKPKKKHYKHQFFRLVVHWFLFFVLACLNVNTVATLC